MNTSGIHPSEHKPSANADTHAETEKKTANESSHKKYRLALYVSILFGVSFLLMLMSYLISLRNNAVEIEQHKSYNVSALKSIESLQDENEALKKENEELEETVASLKSDLASAIEDLGGLQAGYDSELQESQNKLRAMDLLWQLNKLYYERSYDSCRQIVEYMEESELSDFLPETSETSYQTESPKSLYQRICLSLS